MPSFHARESRNAATRRLEAIADFSLAGFNWHGRHHVRLGIEMDRVTYHQSLQRGTILIYRQDDTLDRQASFAGPGRLSI